MRVSIHTILRAPVPAFVLTIFFALAVTLPALAEDEEQSLEEIRGKIHETRQEAKRLAGQESGILSGLMKLDEELTLTNRLLQGLESRRKRIEEQLSALEAEAGRAEGEYIRRRELLEERLVALYKFGGYHEFEVILGSASLVDLVSRFDRIFRVAKRDDQLWRAMEEERTKLNEAREGLVARSKELKAVEDERSQERSSLLGQKNKKRSLLTDVRGKRESFEKLAKELEAASQALERIIAEREARARAVPGMEDFSGPSPFDGGGDRLPWPVRGKIIKKFGKIRHPEFGTEIPSNGIDIEAAYGTDIRAVAGGRVEYVSTLPGYGNCIIVQHGGGYYTLYAHASEILVSQGQTVTPGSLLAKVGDTGSTSGSSLHFEVRKGTKPLDPMRWLK